jgi:hypothetical protein
MFPNPNYLEFNRNAVKPIECLKRGWDVIKDQYWLFVGITLVGLLIGSVVPFGILMGPMMCGIYLALFQRQHGQMVEFGTLFKGFDYFGNAVIVAVLHVIPAMIIIVPFYVFIFFGQFMVLATSGHDGPNPAALLSFFFVFLIGFAIMLILLILLTVGFVFAYPLVVDRGLPGLDAVKLSFKAALANFWGVLGLLLLNGLLSIVGVIFCYVGVIFVLPITLAALSVAYRQVFGEPTYTSPFPPPPPSSFAA